LMLRPPPRPTLFPSRRSSDLSGCPVNVTVAVCPRAVAVTVAGVEVGGTGGRYVTCPPLVPDRPPGPDSDQATSLASCGGLEVIRDRKSTRLNSSHRTISYAVF